VQIITESPIKLDTKKSITFKQAAKNKHEEISVEVVNALRQHVGYYQVPNKSKNHHTPCNVA